MKILINIIRFILIISSFCSKAEIFESIHSTTPIHVTSSKKKNYFNYSLQRLSLKPIINLRNEEVATYLNFEQEKELDKYIKQYASGSIKDLNKAIFDNQKVLDKVGIGTLNYIIDYRNVLSTESKDDINAQLRSLYVETGKSLYIILSPIIPEQLSYAAQASSEFRYSSKNTSIYNTQFTLEQRNEFYKRYTSYVAANSNLSNTSNSGALLNIQSVLHYNKNVNKWVVDFLDYVCFTKNINPEVAQSIAQGIQQYKNQIGGITFSNSISVISQSLIQYVHIIDWEFRIAFVTQNANNQLNRSIGKYRVVLSQISEDDKNAIFQKLTTTNNPTTYNPVKRSGYLVDYANLDSYIERIFWRFSLMNVQTSSDIKCFVYTSSSLNNESGKLAFQLISEKTLEASTIGFGYHFVKEGEQLVMYWNVKLSNDLNGFIDAASLDSMFRDIGSLNFGEATAYYTKHYLLGKYTQAKVAVTDAYQWGYERVFMFYEFVRTVIQEGKIPETVYGDSVILASIVGLLNCVIDEIKGIYQIGVFVMDIALLPTKLLNECLLFFYYYSIDSAFRSRIDANISFISNNIQLITSSIILDIADTFGFAPTMGVPPDNINPETNTAGFQSSLLTKIKNIDVYELDRSITNTLSAPFIAFGTALENCYTNSTLAQKAYCSAYGVGTIVLIFCGEKIYRMAGTLVTKLGTSVLARFTVRLGSSFSKSKISALLDNFVEYAQGALQRIRTNVSKVKAIETIRGVNKSDFINSVSDFANGAKTQLADQAWDLWKQQKWDELHQLFISNDLNNWNGINWPPFNGAKSIIKIEKGNQLAGKVFDRFQVGLDADKLSGRFASPVLNSSDDVADLVFTYDSRALSNSIEEGTYYYKFKIKSDIPEDLVFEYGEAIPWFNLPGTADQIRSNKTFFEIKDHIEIIETLKYEKGKWIPQ